MYKINRKSGKGGFTLLETLIYIALFTVLMTSGFVAVYDLMQSAGSLGDKTRTQEEGNFVLRKISWGLSSLDPSSPPVISGSGCNQILTTYKTGIANPVIFRLNTISGKNYVEIAEDGVNYFELTTDNASTTCLKFSSTGTAPIGITATTTIDGVDFVIKKYVRN
jgi:type II secretory pathway pseudopilin PulG